MNLRNMPSRQLLQLIKAAKEAEDKDLLERVTREWNRRTASSIDNIRVNSFGTEVIE